MSWYRVIWPFFLLERYDILTLSQSFQPFTLHHSIRYFETSLLSESYRPSKGHHPAVLDTFSLSRSYKLSILQSISFHTSMLSQSYLLSIRHHSSGLQTSAFSESYLRYTIPAADFSSEVSPHRFPTLYPTEPHKTHSTLSFRNLSFHFSAFQISQKILPLSGSPTHAPTVYPGLAQSTFLLFSIQTSTLHYIGGSTSRSYMSSFPRPVASPKSAIPTIANISPTQLPSPTLLKVNFTSLPPGTIVEISFVTSLAMSYSGPVRRKQIALISF